MPSTMMSHVLCRFKDKRIVPCARRPQGGCAGDATLSLVKYFPCAHHQPGEIALQKCTNCELIFDIEFSMIQIQKMNMSIRSTRKKDKKFMIKNWKKIWFLRVRAPRACPHNFYFDHCVYNTLVLCFTKEFLWNFVQEKITLKNSENMLFFVVFWKWLKYKSLARKVRTQNNKNPRDTILYYVLFDSFDIISYHVTHYLESL